MSARPNQSTPGAVPKIELVGFECGLHLGPAIVHAKAPGQMFGVTLDDAMHMIDEFAEPGKTFLIDVKAALDRLANVHPLSPLLYRDTDVSWRFISRTKETGDA